MADRLDIANIFVNFLKKARYERLIAEDELEDDQFYATTDGNEKTEYGDLFGNIENQADLYNALYSSRIFTKAMCDDPRGYAIVKALKDRIEYNPEVFDKVGNPTITDDGIASNFSNSNYIKFKLPIGALQGKSWSITCKTLLTSSQLGVNWVWKSVVTRWNAWGSIGVQHESNNIRVAFYGRTGRYTDSNNEVNFRFWSNIRSNPYVINRLDFDINTGTYSLYADIGQGMVLCGTLTSPEGRDNQLVYINEQPNEFMGVGYGTDGEYVKESIDLKAYKIVADGELIFSGAKDFSKEDNYPLYNIIIPYTESRDGVKIVDVQYKDLVDQLYDLTGQGNYIIIDEVNETFRLPLPDIYSQIEKKTSFTLRKWED